MGWYLLISTGDDPFCEVEVEGRGEMKPAKVARGVLLDEGAQDWQVFQQDKAGVAAISLRGRWVTEDEFTKACVIVRVMQEGAMQAVSRALDWREAETGADGSWSITLPDVPCGGLYRIETALQLNDCPVEWALRGDLRHHLAVGDIWVIAGQSNSSGYGKSPARDEPELGLHMFRASGEWELATHPLCDSTGSQYPLNSEGATGSHSPYLAFARQLKQSLGYPIGLIPAALGGSPMSAWTRLGTGELFENMLAYIRDAGGSCRGMLWYQGESDVGEAERAVYVERFSDMVKSFRVEMGDPGLPVITAQLNRCTGELDGGPGHECWEIMRDIQRKIPKQIADMAVISTLDVGLSDGIHNNSAANLVIGGRMANAALSITYGQDVKYRSPDCNKARLIDDQGIELLFDDVDIRLDFECASLAGLPFAVHDSQGIVPLEGFDLTGKNTLLLKLSRLLNGPATVVGAPLTNPASTVPFDIGGYLPMLAFRVAVTEV
jgi:sialate O-acetylesterase